MSKDHNEFGHGITYSGGTSRWFNNTPDLRMQEMETLEINWACPIDDCDGMMVFSGVSWTMNPKGHHHVCNVCEFTAALSKETYPKIIFQPLGLIEPFQSGASPKIEKVVQKKKSPPRKKNATRSTTDKSG